MIRQSPGARLSDDNQVPGPAKPGAMKSDDLSQSSFNTVSDNRVTDFSTDRKAKPNFSCRANQSDQG